MVPLINQIKRVLLHGVWGNVDKRTSLAALARSIIGQREFA